MAPPAGGYSIIGAQIRAHTVVERTVAKAKTFRQFLNRQGLNLSFLCAEYHDQNKANGFLLSAESVTETRPSSAPALDLTTPDK